MILVLCSICCLTLGKILSFPGVHFPHEDRERASLGSFLERFKFVLRHLEQTDKGMWRTGHLGSQVMAKTKILDLMEEWQVRAQEETEGNSASRMLTKIKGMEYAGVGARVSLGKAAHFQ